MINMDEHAVAEAINLMADKVAETEESKGFWDQERWENEEEEYRRFVIMEKTALVHTEVSEFVEVMRKNPNAMSEKIPMHSAGADELADAVIRILGIAKRLGYDIGGAIVAKDKFNTTRPFMHGKRF